MGGSSVGWGSLFHSRWNVLWTQEFQEDKKKLKRFNFTLRFLLLTNEILAAICVFDVKRQRCRLFKKSHPHNSMNTFGTEIAVADTHKKQSVLKELLPSEEQTVRPVWPSHSRPIQMKRQISEAPHLIWIKTRGSSQKAEGTAVQHVMWSFQRRSPVWTL